MTEVYFFPRAREDLLDQATYLAEHASLEIAERFLTAAETSASRLAEMPRIGHVWRGTRRETQEGVRVWTVEGFPRILIFYRVDASVVAVLRILHSARDLPPLLEEYL
jgi:toxin ParE1/3/4